VHKRQLDRGKTTPREGTGIQEVGAKSIAETGPSHPPQIRYQWAWKRLVRSASDYDGRMLPLRRATKKETPLYAFFASVKGAWQTH
jgi:hypothetical protein